MAARLLRAAIFMASFFIAGTAFAAGGACPAKVPVTGNNCYFVAASGADTNSGTSESSPWLHAPGMPNCSGSCAAAQTAFGSSGSTVVGLGIVFRGGDTWHFGNSGASPYTGGTFVWAWNGSSTNCSMPTGTQTGCIYIGVDQTWYNSSVCGSSWCRPIFNGDNPLSSSAVASCPYRVGTNNQIFNMGQSHVIVDNFEILGLCEGQQPTFTSDSYLVMGNGNDLIENVYTHGWTTLPFSCSNGVGICFGGITSFQAGGTPTYMRYDVCDGADSAANAGACFTGNMYSVEYSIFRNNAQVEGGNCHNVHDNILEYWVNTGDGKAHGNVWECNTDYSGSTPNVVYNNIMRHIPVVGDVKFWFCTNATPAEYWFNNVMYDIAPGNYWDVDQRDYSCTPNSTQYMFNNTLEQGTIAGEAPCLPSMTVLNQHNIAEAGSSVWSPGGCTGGPNSLTNKVMTHATANAQGYTSNSGVNTSGQSVSVCANETTPCAPTAASNSTVGAASNVQSYCATLLGSSDALVVAAGNACMNGTTAACTYNTSNHTMNCPAQTVVARPASVAWDAGAYQYANGQSNQQPTPPTNLSAVVQ